MLRSPVNSTVNSGSRVPRAGPLDLIEIAVVEPAEPPRDLRVEPPLLRGAGLEPISPPVIGARRNGHAVGDLERLDEPLACRVDVEFDAIAASEPPVHRREEHAIALPAPAQIGRERRLELEEHLLNRPVRQPRAAVDAEVVRDRPPGAARTRATDRNRVPMRL